MLQWKQRSSSKFGNSCHFKFEREHGFFVGAIYLNYAATVAIAIPGYFVLDYLTEMTLTQRLVLG